MSLFAYLWGIRLFTLLSLFAWIGIVMALDPAQAGTVGEVLFFTSFFAFVLGVITLLMTGLYRMALGPISAAHHLGGAFRQAFLLSLFLVGIAFFQKARVLTWWDALLLLSAVLILELSLRRVFSRNEHA